MEREAKIDVRKCQTVYIKSSDAIGETNLEKQI